MTKEEQRIKSKEYHRSKNGMVAKMHYNQKIRAKKRGYLGTTYSKKELKEWLYSQQLFHVLYDDYKKHSFDKMYAPSVDRIDDYIGYTLSNIQLTTWAKNNKRAFEDRKNGINNKLNYSVSQFYNGKLIAIYHSGNYAYRCTNINGSNIIKVCLGERHTAGGFEWRFTNEHI